MNQDHTGEATTAEEYLALVREVINVTSGMHVTGAANGALTITADVDVSEDGTVWLQKQVVLRCDGDKSLVLCGPTSTMRFPLVSNGSVPFPLVSPQNVVRLLEDLLLASASAPYLPTILPAAALLQRLERQARATQVLVTIVGIYRDLAQLSGDFVEETFVARGTGPDLKAAVLDALQSEVQGGDFDMREREVLAVFDGWNKELNVSQLLLELEEEIEFEDDD